MIIQSVSAPLEFDLFGRNSNDNTSVKVGNSIGYIIVVLALINVVTMIIYSFVTRYHID